MSDTGLMALRTIRVVGALAETQTLSVVVDDADLDPAWPQPASEPNPLGGARVVSVTGVNATGLPWPLLWNGTPRVTLAPNETRSFTLSTQPNRRVNFGDLAPATGGV